MSKKITVAMLLLLMQCVVYSSQPSGPDSDNEGWISLALASGQRPGRAPEIIEQEWQRDQATSTDDRLEEAPSGCFAVVAGIVGQCFDFLKDQAYGNHPFGQQDPASTEKNK
jgi:hypothetical protein